MKPSVLLLILALYSIKIMAGTIDPSNKDSDHIEYGSKFNYVVRLCGTYEDSTKFCASAVLIDDHNFLTAAHVVKNAKSSNLILDNNETFIVEKIKAHEEFADKFGMNDIAIGYSEKPFGLEYYPSLYDMNTEEGKICSIAGFGMHGTFETGTIKSDIKRRAGSNKIEYIDRDLLMCNITLKGSENCTSLEFLIGSGDSGGGLFIDGKLAGINSCVVATDRKPNSSYTDECGHTRVFKFIEWIKKHRHEIKKKK